MSASFSVSLTTARRAMRQAAIDAWFYLQQRFDNTPESMRYWPDRHYISLLQADANRRFSFVYDDYVDLMRQFIGHVNRVVIDRFRAPQAA